MFLEEICFGFYIFCFVDDVEIVYLVWVMIVERLVNIIFGVFLDLKVICCDRVGKWGVLNLVKDLILD